MRANPILDFGIDRASIRYTGHELQRPECILAEPDGTLWSADARGGLVRIAADGSQQIVTQNRSQHFQKAATEATRYLEGTLPNGLAFAKNGDFLISNFGTDCLEIMSRDGGSRVLADSIEGEPIGKVNFVLRDSQDRIWVTISTKIKNWMHALRPDLADGYLARYEAGSFRIVADGFHFTNEIRFDAREEFLYVVETTGGCITRLRIGQDGNSKEREIFGPSSLGKGAWPDGIAFDAYGNLWGTLVYSDKLFVLTPEGDLKILLDEGDPEKVDALERAFLNGQVAKDVLFATGQGIAPWMASVTFGGPDLQTVYIGSPVAGLPMVHWSERQCA
jgi:gluconolactonase